MSKHLFLGVDGGATSCRARLCDLEGNLLGEGSSGPANIHSDLLGSLQSIQARDDVRFGSLADLAPQIRDVSLTPKSRHAQRRHQCLLGATNRHVHSS